MAVLSSTERVKMRGLPGEEQTLHVIFKTLDNPLGNKRLHEPRAFKIQFLLSRPGHSSFGEQNPSFLGSVVGSSHLRIAKRLSERTSPDDVTQLTLLAHGENWSIAFKCVVNDDGCIGKVVVESLLANDSAHAEAVAYKALTPFLSAWSASLDIPIDIETTQVTDLTNHHESLRVRHPYLEMMPTGGIGPQLSDEYCAYASVYREAMNTHSVFYRFLCFYKIIESFYFRRNKLAEEAKSKGQNPRKYTEDVPLTEEAIKGILLWIYPWRADAVDDFAVEQILVEEAKGKRFKFIRQNHLEPLRDTIAHGLMRSGKIETVADRFEDVENVSKWLPLLRVWVRMLFAIEFPKEFAIGQSTPS